MANKVSCLANGRCEEQDEFLSYKRINRPCRRFHLYTGICFGLFPLQMKGPNAHRHRKKDKNKIRVACKFF